MVLFLRGDDTMRVPVIMLGLMGAVALASCANSLPPTTLPPSVVLDDQVGIAVETAYQAAALAERTALRAGFISPAEAPKIAALDNQAYLYVCYTRTGYDLANGLSPSARPDKCPVATKTAAVVGYAEFARAAVDTIKQLVEAVAASKAGE